MNWMAFLNKYKLHGILCDDMGLGKTLQALCILAGDMHVRAQNYKVRNSLLKYGSKKILGKGLTNLIYFDEMFSFLKGNSAYTQSVNTSDNCIFFL